MRTAEEGITSLRGLVRESVQVVLVTVAVALFLKLFVVDAVHVPSASMENTLRPGDFVIVNKLVYGPATPRYLPFTRIRIPSFRFPAITPLRAGDILVFQFPGVEGGAGSGSGGTYVKRLIGLPGQRVAIRRKRIVVDDEEMSMLPEARETRGGVPDFGPLAVPEDHYFVLGDNLADSYDSRFWGCVPADHIIGKAMLVYWSVGDEGIRWKRIGNIIR